MSFLQIFIAAILVIILLTATPGSVTNIGAVFLTIVFFLIIFTKGEKRTTQRVVEPIQPRYSAPASPRIASANFRQKDQRSEMLRLINDCRQQNNLSKLKKSSPLDKIATNHSEWLAAMPSSKFQDLIQEEGKLFKKENQGSTERWQYCRQSLRKNCYAESIGHASNSNNLILKIFLDWENSELDRENILNVDHKQIGIGLSAKGRQLHATVIFTD